MSIKERIQGFLSTPSLAQNTELPSIFPISLEKNKFISFSVKSLFRKIIIDCYDRTIGFNQKELSSCLFDSPIVGEQSIGLISIIVDALYNNSEIFVIFNPSVNVIRLANNEERERIIKEYEANSLRKTGAYISFKNRTDTHLLKFLYELKYDILCGSYVACNIARTIQIKIADLRKTVSLQEKDTVIKQVESIASAMKSGRDIFTDAQDSIVSSSPNMEASKSSIEFINSEISNITGLPLAYITGEQSQGLSTTGEADQVAIERGLRNYSNSIWIPALKSVFSLQGKISFKSENARLLDVSIRVAALIGAIEDEFISKEEKKILIRRQLNLDDASENIT